MRALLLEEKAALTGQAVRLEDEANSLIEEQEMGDVQFDDEGGEGDTMVVERERDLTLSAQARQTIADIDTALGSFDNGSLRLLDRVRPTDPARAPRSHSVGDDAGRGEGRRDRPSMTDDAEAEVVSTPQADSADVEPPPSRDSDSAFRCADGGDRSRVVLSSTS